MTERVTDMTDDEALCNLADRWVAAMRQSDNTREAAVMSALAARIQELTAPPSGDVVERVARALCKAAGEDPDEVVGAGNQLGEPMDVPTWMLWQPEARDLIAAMPDERALIVAWLQEWLAQSREKGDLYGYHALELVIKGIERGDYLEKPHDT